MTDEQRREAIASYYACVSEADAQVGYLMETMDRLKLWEKTIVIFTSDHGWHLGTHGLWGKVTLFPEAARVPLIVIAPGTTQAGSACPRTVESVDLYPTLAELAGLSIPKKLDGISLLPWLKEPEAPRERPAFSVIRRNATWGRAVYTERYRYSEWGDNATKGVELYDHLSDPAEYRNLAKDLNSAPIAAQLQRMLADGLKVRDSDVVHDGPND